MEPLKLGIAGLGTVGAGVFKLVRQQANVLEQRCGRRLEITAVSARDKNRDRGLDFFGVQWLDDARALASHRNVDVVVELIGGESGVARELCEEALQNKKSVVTANKALLAHHGLHLAEMAECYGVSLAFEAAVAGGIPIIKTLREGLTANTVSRVMGILNGTCNYILTTMKATGRSFADVLAEAQALGYAEADPALDINGTDTAHKLTILAALAYGMKPDFAALHIEGIQNVTIEDIHYAAEMGYEVKLLGLAERCGGKIVQRVHPAFVPVESPIASVRGVYNAVMVEAEPVGTLMLEGRGAGEGPTASAVVADIVDIARGMRYPPFTLPSVALAGAVAAGLKEIIGAFYLHLEVLDKPGVLADITSIFRDYNVSVKSIVQKGRSAGENVEVVVVTHEVAETAMLEALRRIDKLESIRQKPRTIRIVHS